MVRLGDIVEQIRGVSYKPDDISDILDDNSVILLRANNIQDGKIVLDDVVYVSKKKVNEKQYLKQGDILVCTSSGSKDLVGKAAYIDEDLPMVFGAFCKVIRPSVECSEYIGHFFQSPYYRNYISSVSAGANINNLRNEHISELNIQIPSLEEQRKIAAVLDKVTDLIAKRRQQLENLDLLVKVRLWRSLVTQWIIQNNGKCNLYLMYAKIFMVEERHQNLILNILKAVFLGYLQKI